MEKECDASSITWEIKMSRYLINVIVSSQLLSEKTFNTYNSLAIFCIFDPSGMAPLTTTAPSESATSVSIQLQ